jgi:hypothetical protein
MSITYNKFIKTEIASIIYQVLSIVNQENLKFFNNLPSSFATILIAAKTLTVITPNLVDELSAVVIKTCNAVKQNISSYMVIISDLLIDSYDVKQKILGGGVGAVASVGAYIHFQNYIDSERQNYLQTIRKHYSSLEKIGEIKISSRNDPLLEYAKSKLSGQNKVVYTDFAYKLLDDKVNSITDKLKPQVSTDAPFAVKGNNSLFTPSIKVLKTQLKTAKKQAKEYLSKLNKQNIGFIKWQGTALSKIKVIESINQLASDTYNSIFGRGRGINRMQNLRHKRYTNKIKKLAILKPSNIKINPIKKIKTRKYKTHKHRISRKQNRKQHNKTHKRRHIKTPLERLRAKLQPKSTRRRTRA